MWDKYRRFWAEPVTRACASSGMAQNHIGNVLFSVFFVQFLLYYSELFLVCAFVLGNLLNASLTGAFWLQAK